MFPNISRFYQSSGQHTQGIYSSILCPPLPHTAPTTTTLWERSIQSLRSILPSVSTISLWMPITPCHSPVIPPSSANRCEVLPRNMSSPANQDPVPHPPVSVLTWKSMPVQMHLHMHSNFRDTRSSRDIFWAWMQKIPSAKYLPFFTIWSQLPRRTWIHHISSEPSNKVLTAV